MLIDDVLEIHLKKLKNILEINFEEKVGTFPSLIIFNLSHLNVSNIIVNSTNFPNKGTTNDVGGIISANKRKKTVNDSKIDMLNDTCKDNIKHT